MRRSYAILVEYDRGYLTTCPAPITLHVNVNSEDLGKLLLTLDASEAVAKLSVSYTVALPVLHKITKLNNNDLGFLLEKLK